MGITSSILSDLREFSENEGALSCHISPFFLVLDVAGKLLEVHEFGCKVFAAVSLAIALPFLGHGALGPVRLREKAPHLQVWEETFM